jgi:hypothetical protein
MKNFLIEHLLMPILRRTEGWKSIVSYLVINVAGGDLVVVDAIHKALADPTAQNIIIAAAHVLLLIGLSWRGLKNINPRLDLKRK